jgi:hypothetical protein
MLGTTAGTSFACWTETIYTAARMLVQACSFQSSADHFGDHPFYCASFVPAVNATMNLHYRLNDVIHTA